MEKDEKEILLQKFADANRRLLLAQEQLDIANKKLKEYEEKAKNAEKASKMKSLFLANMSHEIRTPLNAIEGFSRVIVETDSQEDRMKFFEIIESNNNRLMNLVNEILDLSRVESGEIVMKKSHTDLNELCDSIKNIFKFRCPDTLKLIWNKPTMAVVFNTDANRLTQVFSNLITVPISSSLSLIQARVLPRAISSTSSRPICRAMQRPPTMATDWDYLFVRSSSRNSEERLL